MAIAGLGSGCAALPASLNPASPPARQITDLSWLLFGMGWLIWLMVMVLLLGGLFRRRAGKTSAEFTPPAREDVNPQTVERWVVGGGIVMPAIVLVVLIVFTLNTMRGISQLFPFNEVVLEVTGHQWWWDVRYPSQRVITANEIHIPVGQAIEVKLLSADVIHSFWVPELHGKFDLIPGQTHSFILQADLPGEYRGQCAEFCGLQHALMGLIVIAHTEEEFNAWVDAQARPAVSPTETLALTGQEIFLQSRCAECHTIRGTTADGLEGPDLTHFASRQTLAAGTLTNTPEHLSAWISDPQSVKPGSLMPVVPLETDEFDAILAYLATLK